MGEHEQHADILGVAVVGAGYWGPNLARNFATHPDTELRWVVDLARDRAEAVARRYPGTRVTDDLDDVLSDPATRAIAIVTPAATHAQLALAAIDSGRHVLVEKPLAAHVTDGEKMVDAADRAGVVLMCDHTFCYTPVVRRIRELVASGALGEIQYVDAVRINLGLVQRDVDVFWDLAPHDLSILDYILPSDRLPIAVSAQGADPLRTGVACVGYLTLPLAGGGIAHAHVNWLSPTKVRTTIVGGSHRTAWWDDLNPYARLSIHDRGVDVSVSGDQDQRRERLVSYRTGDIVTPTLPEREALVELVGEFAAAIRDHRAPVTDGRSGLRVLRVLEAVNRSLSHEGQRVPLKEI